MLTINSQYHQGPPVPAKYQESAPLIILCQVITHCRVQVLDKPPVAPPPYYAFKLFPQ